MPRTYFRPQATCCVDKPHYAKGMCRTCYYRKYRKDNPDKTVEKDREWRKNNRHRAYWYRRRHLYGIEPHEYMELYESQGGKCKICKTGKATDVDHCHSSGIWRGLLCHDCNLGIGFLKDNPDTLRSAAEYLDDFKSKPTQQ